MKYDETGFRGVYQTFVTFPLEAFKESVINYPGYEKADCVLGYGFAREAEGIFIAAVACGRHMDNGVEFFAAGRAPVFVSIRKLRQYDFMIVSEKDLRERYADKISSLREYDASSEVMESRTFAFLDDSRDPYQIDDVQVELVRDNVESEFVTVRITGLEPPYIIGRLLDEPSGDFGVHMGDVTGFYVRQSGLDETVLTADLNPSESYGRNEVVGLLEEAIEQFTMDPNERTYTRAVTLLRDSELLVPYLELNHQNLERLVKKKDDQITSHQIPDILRNSSGSYFPAFTSEEAMGEYGRNYIVKKKPFTEILREAENSAVTVDGIMINAFGFYPFVLKKELFEAVAKMESRIR